MSSPEPRHITSVLDGVDLEQLYPLRPCEGCYLGCSGKEKDIHCPICPINKFKPTNRLRVVKHLKAHFEGKSGSLCVRGYRISTCPLRCYPTKRARHINHYHCPLCCVGRTKRHDFVKHVEVCNGTPRKRTTFACNNSKKMKKGSKRLKATVKSRNDQLTLKPDKVILLTADQDSIKAEAQDDATSDQGEEEPITSVIAEEVPDGKISIDESTLPCPVCGKQYNRKYLKDHIERKHTESSKERKLISPSRHHFSVSVGPGSGLFTVSRAIRGPQHPIHVMCVMTGPSPRLDCPLTSCQELMQTEWRSGNTAYSCPHLQSVQYNKTSCTPCTLKNSTLTTLVKEGHVSEAQHQHLQDLLEKAHVARAPLLVEIPSAPKTSGRYRWFSVYSGPGRAKWWCKFDRVVVTVDNRSKRITCHCKVKSCVHKSVTQWWLYQSTGCTTPTLITDKDGEASDSSDEEAINQEKNDHEDEEMESDTDDASPDGQAVHRTVDYLYDVKRIDDDVLKKYKFNIDRVPKTFRPNETKCAYCQCPLGPLQIATRRCQILVVTGPPLKGSDAAVRLCPTCKMEYRYQEWHHGIFNFNNRLFISLPLLKLARKAFACHTPIARFATIFEEQLGSISFHMFERAYFAFEAMVMHSYSFSCVCCGYHPKILIYHLTSKTAFQYDASEVNKTAESEPRADTVDTESFWDDVQKELIAHGVVQSGVNPYKLWVSYDRWAPYIGPHTRQSASLYNTEFKKVQQVVDPDTMEVVTEDVILQHLVEEKVESVRRFARKLGLSTSGSKLDILNRIQSASVSRSNFDSAYSSVYNHSGGWVSASCPHGVIYAIKCLLRLETPMDYVDILRSFKHIPTINIVENADIIAKVANKLVPNMFHPNEGRLAPPTHENINLAKNKSLELSLPVLCDDRPVDSPPPGVHPITGLTERFCLFDWFHNDKTLRCAEDHLRRSSLLKELARYTNTQAGKLSNREKSREYLFNSMLPVHHLFCYRLKAHLRNEDLNQQEMARQSSKLSGLTLNEIGQLVRATPIDPSRVIGHEESVVHW